MNGTIASAMNAQNPKCSPYGNGMIGDCLMGLWELAMQLSWT